MRRWLALMIAIVTFTVAGCTAGQGARCCSPCAPVCQPSCCGDGIPIN